MEEPLTATGHHCTALPDWNGSVGGHLVRQNEARKGLLLVILFESYAPPSAVSSKLALAPAHSALLVTALVASRPMPLGPPVHNG